MAAQLPPKRRVAVIEAGPAGAIATDALVKEQAFDTVRVFDRRDRAGGTWVLTKDDIPGIPSIAELLSGNADLTLPAPQTFPSDTPLSDDVNSPRLRYADTAAHELLHSNLPPEIMAFIIRQWVEDVFTKGGHSNLVEYNTTVELAEKRRDEWVLTLRRAVRGGEKNEWWQETFDALIVASGHYHQPWIPSIPGLATYEARFPGRIQHTKHYLTAEDYKDKITFVDAETGRITFVDGTWVDDVDVLLFATGYGFSFSFLSEIKSVNKRIPGLYQHVFLAKDPSVAFLGMCTGGFGLRIFEWQAAAAARVFAGRGKLPSRKDMEIWEERRVAEKGDSPAFWTLLPDFEVHFEALRAIAGDPAPRTTGRVLPVYDPAWAGKFWAFIKFRKE
ncbi:thiol-specific monooxygenase [Colletotrichum sojae]|uniref:Thiol-specific monooxygenase n=1 Tax=Colletotrichum sojae TaxID=2175907 RepID=A0A8H6J5F7_9PEZI|nr:thiol-specific monooxygenase [Colletotrichum sojae]